MRHSNWPGGIFTFVVALVFGVVLGSAASQPGNFLSAGDIEISEQLN
jgi:hypothetical protein